ncbi:MAG: flavodoxin [Bacteroidota bacterium]|nr:flavodoxin [Bacteroidota bacterium]
MKKVYFALPIIAVFLAFISVQGQINSISKEHSLSNMGNKSKEKTLPLSRNEKILVAYFSHSGNTREIANQIHKKAGGDIFEIQPVKPYPNDYDAVVKQAQEEQAAHYKPVLKTKIENIKSYDVVFIGYPNWWGTIPPPVRTFLSTYDFSGKTIVPFCTHEGSGLGQSVKEISKLCPKSTILNGLAVRGSDVHKAQNEVSQWLHKIKITK